MTAQLINVILGIWLMISPAVLGSGPAASDNNHIFGPLITTFATIALWEATRVVRRFNLPIAIWLIAAPFILQYGHFPSTLNSIVAGVVVFGLSLIEGRVESEFGGGWASLWKN